MRFFIVILSIYIFIETAKYAIFEFKEQQNKVAGVILFILSVACSVGVSTVTYIKY